MRKMKNIFSRVYYFITGSIAFYPTLIALGFFLLSFIIMILEYKPFMIDIKEDISFLLVKSKDDARLILGTLVGSIISLMVFSFSMVMIVLNRASATLSPRVIPGLITDKSNQVVLGFYLGSIIYTLILIINIQSEEAEYRIPTFGVFMSMVLGINCLGFFVYFIHSISQAIQVDNILNSILKSTKLKMDQLSLADDEHPVERPDVQEWSVLRTRTTGYMKRIKIRELLKICEQYDLHVQLRQQVGFFYVLNYPYLSVDKPIDEDVEEQIHTCFMFYPEERLEDHYIFGIKQISEIAVKAMSPGINDPGTAVKAIDMLSDLFIKKMHIREKSYVSNSDGEVRIFFAAVPLEQLLYENLTPIRQYAKTDAIVMVNILESLKNLLYADSSGKYNGVLLDYISSMIDSCQQNIDNRLDLRAVNEMIGQINRIVKPEEHIRLLETADDSTV